MAEQKLELESPLGLVTLHQNVLAAIAARALEKVEGARPLKSGGGIMGIFGGGEEGLRLSFTGEAVDVELKIAVIFGYPVHEVARGVQQAVREDLEKLASVKIGRVDVYVKQVIPEEETLVLKDEEGEEEENAR